MRKQPERMPTALRDARIPPPKKWYHAEERDHILYILVRHDRDLFQPRSRGSRTYYTGATNNFSRRLSDHNNGRTRATSGASWGVLSTMSGFTAEEAYATERYLKRGDTCRKRAVFLAYAAEQVWDDTAQQRYLASIGPTLWRRTPRRPERDDTPN